jgi:D-lactate dehydrogenase
MKVVAYSVRAFEKEFLAKANQKKHDITLISNALSMETAAYSSGKDAVVVFTNDDVSAPVINRLADLGIKYIVTRSTGTDHIDKQAAAARGIKLANVPAYSPHAIAEHAVALALSLNRHLLQAYEHSHNFNFKLDGLIGFNFHGKTVGLIGLGDVGQAAADILNGFGCRVIGYDIKFPDNVSNIEYVSFEELLSLSDIISLHAPLNADNRHMINKDSLELMKNGVMLINTSRGGLIDTAAVLEALNSGKVGYLGLDVYENEKGIFGENHDNDIVKDPMLELLIAHQNVFITPHQAFLTNEALQQIANQTIKNLDLWQQDKCVGNACSCSKNCRSSTEPVTVKQNPPL